MKAKLVIISIIGLLVAVNLAIWFHPQWRVWQAKREMNLKFEKKIHLFRTADAQKDAATAAAKGDYFFYSVMGYGWSLPGITNRHLIKYVHDHRQHYLIPGTSDYSRSRLEAEYNNAARAYAKAYNLALEKLISTNSLSLPFNP